MKKQFYILMLVSVISMSGLSGCSSKGTVNNTTAEALNTASALESWVFEDGDFYTYKDADTKITFDGATADINGDGAELSEGGITINGSGIYELMGTFNGNIVIDTDGEVQLVLNNTEINSSDGSSIYAKNCKKLTVSTTENSINSVSDSNTYTLAEGEDEPDAALFAKGDLVINGLGELNITGNYNDGIKGKDNVIITEGKITVNAVDDAITGRDVLAVTGAEINVVSGGDSLKTTNFEETEKGALFIEGGTISIEAKGDGIDSANAVYINNGEMTISAGSGAESATRKYTGESKRDNTFDMDEVSQDSVSQKGVKAENTLSVSGGTLSIDTYDDGIHSNNDVYISGGTLNISSGDDGVHADNALEISGGALDIATSYEGLEGYTVTITGGDISLYAQDDGINAAGSSAEGDSGAKVNENGGQSGSLIAISGGYVFVNADGDGIDSNDAISITGGTLIINGPVNNGNGALDFDSSMALNGGTLIASGSGGMLQASDRSSELYSVVVMLNSAQDAGKAVVLTTSEGEIVTAVAPKKEYSAVTIGSELIETGKEYKLVYGAVLSGTEKNGVYSSYSIQSSEGEIDFSVSDKVTYINESGVTDASSIKGAGGMKGGMMGNGQKQPEDMGMKKGEKPTDTDGMQKGDRPSDMVAPPEGDTPPDMNQTANQD